MHPPSIYRIKILAYIKSIIPTSGFQEQIVKWICKVSIWFMKWTCLFCNWGNVSNHKISSVLCKLDMMSDNYQSCVNPNQVGEGQRGCCIRSPLATKLLHGVLFPEDITQQDLKNLALGIQFTCDKKLHQVSAMSVHYFWSFEHFSFFVVWFCFL